MKVIVIDGDETSLTAAAATLPLVFGQLEPYRPSISWATYRDRLEFFFEANRIANDAQKRAIFLTSVGQETYEIVRTLVAPLSPRNVDFQAILTHLNTHFNTTANEVVQRFKFYSRVQLPNETVAEYVSEVRRLSENCNFTERDKSMRDRIVCGISRYASLYKRFFSQPQLTFGRACELAFEAEAFHGVSNTVSGTDGTTIEPESTQKSRRMRTKPYSNCSRCASGNHNVKQCPESRRVSCEYCKKKGHVEEACFEKRRSKKLEKQQQDMSPAAGLDPESDSYCDMASPVFSQNDSNHDVDFTKSG